MNRQEEARSVRETIRFYLIDADTVTGKVIDISIIILNVFVCFLFVAETYPIFLSMKSIIWRLEIGAVIFFIVEYILRLYGSRERIKHMLSLYSIIDLLAIVPTLLLVCLPVSFSTLSFVRIIRVFRVFRVFRFLRFTENTQFFFGNVTMQLLKVVRLLLTIFIIFFISSGLFWAVEHEVNDAVHTFGDAFYFTVVALTTVGFGDVVPTSEAGRWVTVLMILSGIILIPWQAGQLIREWIRMSNKRMTVCKGCGLTYHDRDASHCKSCGNLIYQEYDGE